MTEKPYGFHFQVSSASIFRKIWAARIPPVTFPPYKNVSSQKEVEIGDPYFIALLCLTSAVPSQQDFMQRVDLGKTLLLTAK